MIETLANTPFLKNKDNAVGIFCEGEFVNALQSTQSLLNEIFSITNEETVYSAKSPVSITFTCNISSVTIPITSKPPFPCRVT